MKKIFIPKGETVCYDELFTDVIVVQGRLQINGQLIAKSVQGDGVIEATEIICDSIKNDTVIAQIITAEQIFVKKLLVKDCRAKEIIVTSFIEALNLQADSLSMTASAISTCNVEKIIVLTPKKRSMLKMLFSSWLKERKMRKYKIPKTKTKKVTETTPVQAEECSEPVNTAEPTTVIDGAFINALADAIVEIFEQRGVVKQFTNVKTTDNTKTTNIDIEVAS